MITFFRKIRQNLISGNKFSKYLLYAIGEILLVVIGILIALSINNKNNEVLERRAEKNFYENIKEQLMDDVENIRSQIRYNSDHTDQFRYAIRLIDLNNRQQKDSLSKIAMNLANYSDFDRQGNIYETMVNSGDIRLLRNNVIIERIRRLEETYIYVNRLETIHSDAVMTLVPELMKVIRFSSGKVEDEAFLYSFKSQNMFVMSNRIMGEKDVVYHRALDEINEVLTIIDEELKP